MRRATALIGLLALSACAPQPAVPVPARPLRVVSLDYCADQYVLGLLPRERILAVSPGADQAFSYHREQAAGVRQVASRVEDVLVLRPDLVVRTYGGGPDAARLLERAGVPVLQIGSSDDLPGIRRTLLDAAAGLGARAEGQALAAQMDARVTQLRADRRLRKALYMTPAGVTSGPGSLVHELMRAARLDNFQSESGWHPLPLERLAYERPDLVVAAFYNFVTANPDSWSAARHPIARAQLTGRPRVELDGAWMACGGWFVLDAAEAMARGAS